MTFRRGNSRRTVEGQHSIIDLTPRVWLSCIETWRDRDGHSDNFRADVLSVHATEQGAKLACEKLRDAMAHGALYETEILAATWEPRRGPRQRGFRLAPERAHVRYWVEPYEVEE